ncbi:MAG: phosphotransferase [Planctomycetota bacterium]
MSEAPQSAADQTRLSGNGATALPSGPSAALSGAGTGASASAARSAFAADELAIVLSHYPTGILTEAREFARGSRKAPKLRVKAKDGDFLLKRRAAGKDDPRKVAFCHSVQIHLAERQFPLPHLIGTLDTNNSMLKHDGNTYELFEYIKGTGYDFSLDATGDAGQTLGLFHKLLLDFTSDYDAARGTYHRSKSVHRAMQALPDTLQRTAPPTTTDDDFKRQEKIGKFLADAYLEAAKRVEDQGYADWPQQVVHSDWHPGNMLFRGSRVVAVIDYDTVRFAPRVLDTANGSLQFSIRGGGEDPSQWPDDLDVSRYKRFLRGYDAVPDNMLTNAELRAVPWLMVEALIAESVIPVAATGFFSRMAGGKFLEMVVRKVQWLRKHADQLVEAVA